ncbi:MAG TPA: DUF1801 domain-containing protein [Candidatus Saccharibacteria bacterium]|nr:DUF1801 domain-containing protein [Candidatus Saccharibacteria bacterium]
MSTKVKTIDEFISNYPDNVQVILQKIRQPIHKVAPEVKETISYGIPTFTLNGNLVHFSAYKHHIGFYPGSEPIMIYKDELKPLKTSKGTVQFPLDQPIPYDLIKKISLYRVNQKSTQKKQHG